MSCTSVLDLVWDDSENVQTRRMSTKMNMKEERVWLHQQAFNSPPESHQRADGRYSLCGRERERERKKG